MWDELEQMMSNEQKDTERLDEEPTIGEQSEDADVPSEAAAEEGDVDVAGLTSALAEARETIDTLQRQAAELDNRRKRVERMAEDATKFALQDLALELLPVIDNFERALGHADGSSDAKALHDGLQLVHDQLLGVLKKFHVEKIEALGRPFDPHCHEAVGQMESAEHPEQTVIDVHQEGYLLHDRVIRPSRVIVSRAPAGDDEGAAVEDE